LIDIAIGALSGGSGIETGASCVNRSSSSSDG
jgi:hypothetical protein